MGLLPNEYYRLTPVEFGFMYSGFIKKEKKRKKDLRFLTYFVIKGYADPKDFPQSPEQWWRIDEDDDEAIKTGSINIDEWSEDKRNDAISLIERMTKG